ncbi:hypothetical protein JTE90_021185 [Oedothorax gibbosus]|uniref:Uncharacterized protein n=1 Tax=Oedothorax gibbosus TaxID=931172 RepID=A0AAV6V771_9ARAC|nr:hypothetical protein JTE90_021185 [Oedothorax gibbosus]
MASATLTQSPILPHSPQRVNLSCFANHFVIKLNETLPHSPNYSHFDVIRSDKSNCTLPPSPLSSYVHPDWEGEWTLPTCLRDGDGCRRKLTTQPHPRQICTCSVFVWVFKGCCAAIKWILRNPTIGMVTVSPYAAKLCCVTCCAYLSIRLVEA